MREGARPAAWPGSSEISAVRDGSPLAGILARLLAGEADAAPAGAAAEGAPAEGALPEGALAHGALFDGAPDDDALAEGALADGALADAALSDAGPSVADLSAAAAAWYRGRSVVVTGAGGSIGSALCRRLLALGPARIVLLDHAEAALFDAARRLEALAPAGSGIVPVLGSVCDARAVARALSGGADIVFHAAACKHVPLAETNAATCVATNLLGTATMIRHAREAGAGRFILVSTDKAIRPAGVMGASKRLAEIAALDHGRRAGAPLTAVVRFGNVLGSSGSVVPILCEQIARGGPLTISHPEAERYFMTMRGATTLLLHAGHLVTGGETFFQEMGDPVRILDLAEGLIRAARRAGGARPAVRFTGLRPGEKLREAPHAEAGEPVAGLPGLRRAFEPLPGELAAASVLRTMRELVETGDEAAIGRACIDLARRLWTPDGLGQVALP